MNPEALVLDLDNFQYDVLADQTPGTDFDSLLSTSSPRPIKKMTALSRRGSHPFWLLSSVMFFKSTLRKNSPVSATARS